MINSMIIKKNYIVMKLIHNEHRLNQYYYLNYNEIMKKGNVINPLIIKKNYILMNLINIQYLHHQYHYLNNEIMKKGNVINSIQ